MCIKINNTEDFCSFSHERREMVAFCTRGEWLRKSSHLMYEKRELFISTVPRWCLKSVAVLAKGAYRYSYRNAGAALEVALSNSARVYAATTYNLYFAPAAPFSLVPARVGSPICHISDSGEAIEQDKRAFKPRTKARVAMFRSAMEFKGPRKYVREQGISLPVGNKASLATIRSPRIYISRVIIPWIRNNRPGVLIDISDMSVARGDLHDITSQGIAFTAVLRYSATNKFMLSSDIHTCKISELLDFSRTDVRICEGVNSEIKYFIFFYVP